MSETYRFSNFIADDFELPLTYIDPIIPVNSIIMFFGPPKSCKSVLVQQMGLDIAAGKSFLNLFDIPVARKVLYLQNELADVWLQDRWRHMIKNYTESRLDNLFYHNIKGLFLNDEDSYDKMCRIIADIKPNIVILDSLYYALIGDVSDGGVVNSIIRRCDKILSLFAPISIVLVHHQRKVISERPDLGMEEMLGSTQLAAWPSVIIRMKREEGDQKKLQFMFRYYSDISPLDLELDSSRFILEVKTSHPASIIESGISTCLSNEPKCYNEIFHRVRDEMGVSRAKVASSITAMIKMGKVQKVFVDGSELFSLISTKLPDSLENKNLQ